jgi:UDPglucose 6-dehydrogenase
MPQARALLPASVQFCSDAYEAATGADALVMVTEWNEFRALSPTRLRELMRGNLVMDLRNVFEPDAFSSAGFDYRGVGRGTHQAGDQSRAAAE